MAHIPDTPGLYLHASNRMEALAEQLSRVMLERSDAQTLEGDLVVVQTPGIARWLSMRLADHTGCCLNVNYLYPRNFVQEMLLRLAGVSSKLNYNAEAFTWTVYGHLREFAATSPIAGALRRYLEDGSNLKQLQLAERLARMYDNYTVYRPDFIRSWRKEQDPDNWQAEYWRYLSARAPDALPYTLAEQIENAGQLEDTALPETVYLFALSTLPPAYVEFLGLIACTCSVHIFHNEPAGSFWGDIVSRKTRILSEINGADEADLLFEGNPLLGSMGKQGRDFANLLLDASVNPVWESFLPQEEDTLLAQLQNDILELVDRSHGENPLTFDESDRSLRIANCHGPTRELEALKDYLLDAFECDKSLRPRDVLVLTPDIEALSPYIETVFGTQGGEECLPFGVADRGPTECPALEAFLQILRLPTGRFTSREVLGIMERPVVREKFSLTESDLNYVRSLVKELNIRWGLDKEQRADMGFSATDRNSWSEGLHRLALGAAMLDEEDSLYEGLLPHYEIEGDRVGIVERFLELAFVLVDFAREAATPASLQVWCDRLQGVIAASIAENDDTRRDLGQLRKVLLSLRTYGSALPDPNEPIDIPALRHFLESHLAEKRPPGGFLGGGITFAELKPMRSVPAKVVCLIGMNDEVFPRRDTLLPFDLMAQERRIGDRSQRDGDRYLFLETLLSARNRLYISYSGVNSQGTGESPPSVLVSELLDYIRRSSGSDFPIVDKIVIRHRLHGFNPEYFDPSSKTQSYSAQNAAAARALLSKRKRRHFAVEDLPPLLGEERVITLDDLVRFFQAPQKYFLERRLGMSFLRNNGLIEEDEPASLDSLVAYKVKDVALAQLLEFPERPLSPEKDIAQGILPWGAGGQALWAASVATSMEINQKIHALANNCQPRSITAHLTIPAPDDGPAYQVDCKFPYVIGDRQILWRVSKLKEKHSLSAWISHLAALVGREDGLDAPTVTHLLCEDDTESFGPLADARAELTSFIHIFHLGQQRPLPFFPVGSAEYVRPKKKEQDHDSRLKRALKEWMPTTNNGYPSESEDPYVKMAFPGENPLHERTDDFVWLAEQVWSGYFKQQGSLES